MLFSSLAYLLLMTLTRVLEIVSKRPAWILLLASAIFYVVAGWYDTAIFFGCVVTNWAILKILPPAKIRIWVAVIFNIGVLASFKYAEFLFGHDPQTGGSYIDVALPLGISFYIFQMVAYQVDVVRGVSKEASSFKSFLLFKAFFPQLVAGPIVRAHELLPQIERLFEGKKKKVRLASYGLGLLLLGLIKKVVFADSIAPFVDDIFGYGPESMAWAWLGSVLFAFQLYFDFSGYSDMAIGSAYLLGIKLPINFRTPYLSRGPREFWQRWHITLSTWIRDYLYIPLGGSKGTWLRNGLVVIGTMAVAGLWHGADTTFILWGGIWGAFIFVARYFKWLTLPSPLGIALNFTAVVLLWVLFRSTDMAAAVQYYKIMLGLQPGQASDAVFYEQTHVFPVLIGISALMYCFHILESRLSRVKTLLVLKKWDGWFLWSFMIGLILLIILLPKPEFNSFIYFRF